MSSHGVSRVLVADDVRDSADTLAAILSGNGFDARAVYDGRDAVTVAGLWHPDAALLDLSLPGLSGFEVAREFRRTYGRQIRLVAYTGWGTATDRDCCLDAGFDGFIAKPADPQQLLQVLGKTTGELVQRSTDARVRQLHRQIELGHALLTHGEARHDALEPICAFLDRAFDACRASLPGLPMHEDERRRLGSELEGLCDRIARIRSARPGADRPGQAASA
jgi:CheY-like chemotaxis protein